MKKYFKIYFFSFSLFIFMIALIRSVRMGITCDEAITYLLFVTKKWTLTTELIANNHLLNTLLIIFITNITKISFNAFVMRIPNLMFYLMYIYYVYQLSNLYKNKTVIATMLLLNYGANEFFSLARGYGIASAFIISGLYYYKLYLKEDNIKYLKIAFFTFLMASFAHTTNLIIVGCFGIDTIIRMIKKHKMRDFLRFSKKYICCIALFFLFLFLYHLYLSFSDQLLSNSMCHKDLFSCLIYSPINYYGSNFINKIIVILVCLLSIILFIYNFKNIKFTNDNLFYMILMIYTVFIICKIIFPFELPTGRTLIPFISVYILSIVDFINLFSRKYHTFFIQVIIICLCIFSFFKNLNVDYVREWKLDNYLKKLVEEKYKNGEKIELKEISKDTYPTFQFYYEKYKKLYFYELMSDDDYSLLVNTNK